MPIYKMSREEARCGGFFQALKRQVPSFSVKFHPSVQNRSALQLIYQVSERTLAPQLRFKDAEEAIHERIVVTILFASHAHDNAVASQERLIVLAGILASPVRMVQ